MKEKLLSWGTLICLAVLTCLLLVQTLAIYPGVPAIRWFFATAAVAIARSDGPAWVQAVGSIVAIAAAIGIAMWQRQGDQAKEKRAAQARDKTIADMAADSLRIFERVRDLESEMQPDRETNRVSQHAVLQYLNYKIRGPERLDHDLFAARAYMDAMQRVAVVDLADAKASAALIGALFGLQTLVGHLELMRESFAPEDSRAHFLFGGVLGAEMAVSKAHALFVSRSKV
ncbi:hypothetical protein [Variovorax sp. 770b2]|uniref:hypothetical protein n=1 Tax=Variovorax sp. 770b2 TaxID=1566271 RepID=UPI0008E0C9A3|nr:hypothetical protein [Variovorax sp. 770b2]SFQ41151.1 hypothetical protein SAMN03159339_0391 [Variovorax sp. 770b2]